MKQIKFRGLRTDGKGWVEGYYVAEPDLSVMPHVIYSNKQFVEIHPKSIAMFTGLTDKNGKEIFGSIDGSKGGDVLMYIGSNMSSMDVQFENGMFVGVGPFNTHPLHYYFLASDFNSIEIIGNQYENN